MKRIIIFRATFLFSLFIFFYGCKDSSTITNNDTIYGSGKVVSELRTVDECSGLTIKNVGDVYLTQGDTQSIRIEADDNIIDKVITQKNDGILQVGLQDGSYSNITLKMYISLKNVCSLSIDGTGKVSVEKSIKCDTLNCAVNGAGNLSIIGSADFFICSVNGAGNVSAKDFIAKKCSAFVNGTGNCIIYVTDELNASVNGVGKIIYYGNPTKVTTYVSGMGQIKKG